MWFDGEVVAKKGVGQHAAGSNGNSARRFWFCPATERQGSIIVSSHGHVRIDQHSLRQLDSDAAIHQGGALPLPEYAINFGEICAVLQPSTSRESEATCA